MATRVRTGVSTSYWRVHQDAADKLYVYLRQRDIPLNGAGAITPILLRCQTGGDPPLQTRGVALGGVCSLDFEPDRQASLEFAEGGEDRNPTVAFRPAVYAATDLCGSITYFLAAPLSKSW
jgi:hypothetical protein